MATSVPADATIEHAAITRVVRVMFPHAQFPDGPYERSADAILASAEEDQRGRAAITQGLVDLDAAAGGDGFGSLDDAAALEVLRGQEHTPFFQFVHAKVVTTLYNDPEVWAILGWEGESFSQGGYQDRGFDDLDWLPAADIGGPR